MTRNKAGQNPPTEDSASVPIHEARTVTTDGPEGYVRDASIRQSEDDNTIPERNNGTAGSRSGSTTVPESPKRIQKHLAVNSAPFGSPFAYSSYQSKPDFFKGLLRKHTFVLFDQIVAEAPFLRERLLTALMSNGSNGQFCVLKQHPSINSDSRHKSDGDDSQLEIYCFEPNENTLKLPLYNTVDSIECSDAPSLKNGSSKADEVIDVRRVQKPRTDDTEYFVVNKDLKTLFINNTGADGTIDVDTTVIAGPLPDFAVLETDHFSIFWWRTPAALDYTPNLKRKRNSEDNDEEGSRKAFKGNIDSSPDLQVNPDSKTWLEEYRRRMALCDERPTKYAPSITDLHPPHQQPVGEMRDIDVILAIGAVWLGLMNAKIDFAYANSNLFLFARSMRMVGMHAVKGTNPFVMPLIFNPELQALAPESGEDTAEPIEPAFSAFQRGEEEKNQENVTAAENAKQKDPGNKNRPPLSLKDQEIELEDYKGGIGHFVLAIAEKVDREGHNTIKDSGTEKALVRLKFMDSAEGALDKGVIRRVARNIVRNSGWLGDIWPCFDTDEEHWIEVLAQSSTRCGEHTVLNAWAYMLDIPLATTRKGALAKTSYEEVRRMIRLALQGQLDSLTIRAWMQNYHYAVDESLSQLQQIQTQNPGLPNNFRNIQTVALNEDTFNEIVNHIHVQEQADDQHQATTCAVSLPPEAAAIQQSGYAPNVTNGAALPPGQDAPAESSGTSDTSANSTTSAIIPQPPQASLPPPRNWNDRLAQGLVYHRTLRSRNLRTTEDALKDATRIRSFSNMADYEVVLGIAPIWEGLKRLGRADCDFTYAGMEVFSPGGEQQGVGAVGRWSRFIMPLYFPPTDDEALEDQAKGKEKVLGVGHLLLCVAELVDDRPMTVQIQILDSMIDTVSRQRITLKVQTIIHDSGWLGPMLSSIPVIYRPYILMRVPQQVGHNTCGLHAIFNAWATMLGIPIQPSLLRRKRSDEGGNVATDDRFLKVGLEIVNLALAGFMDSTTIQAFFNVFGYAVEQRSGDRARAVIPVNAVGMNQDKFRLTLTKRHWSSRLAFAKFQNLTFPDEATAHLAELGLSEDEAWTALAIAGGDSQRAFHWHFGQDIPGALPRPEEALSPQTPDRGRTF